MNFNIRINTIVTILITIIISSCKKNEYLLFNKKDNGIYFSQSSMVDTIPSAYFGFMDNDTTIAISLMTSGVIVDSSRGYNLKTSYLAENNAILNYDYIINGNYTIAANKYNDTLYIHITNHHLSSDSSDKFITLNIIPNSNFDTLLSPLQTYDSSSFQYFNTSASSVRIRITYKTLTPTFWDDYSSFLGDFSGTKMKEFIKVEDLPLIYLVSDSYSYYISANKIITAIYDFEGYLQDKADTGTPILDGDGNPMQLGPFAPVFY